MKGKERYTMNIKMNCPHLLGYSVPVQVALAFIHPLLVEELALVGNQQSIAHKFSHCRTKQTILRNLRNRDKLHRSLLFHHNIPETAFTQAAIGHNYVGVTATLVASLLAPVLDADWLVCFHHVGNLELWIHLETTF